MLNCIIVEDESHASTLLEEYIEKTPFLSLIRTFKNPIEALSFLQQASVDLVFLDIQMPELSGIEFLRILGGKTKVIITSAHTEYAIEGYKHDVVDYLLKPISFDMFFKAAQKVLEATSLSVNVRASSENNEKFILVKTETKGKMIKVNIKDIYYIEGLKNYVSIYTQTDRIIAHLNIKDLEKKLPATHFLRVHKSYIVSIDKISSIESNQILLKDAIARKNAIPLGVTYREAFYQTLQENIMDKK